MHGCAGCVDVQDAWMCRMRGCMDSCEYASLCGYIHREMAMKLKARTCI